MRSLLWLQIIRLSSLLALGASVALTIDYLSVEPSFCGGASGCGAIRESGIGSLRWGERVVPILPLAGVAAFAGLFQLSLLSDVDRRQRWAGLWGAFLLPAGLVLLGIQAWLGTFCSLCVVVDLCAIGAGALSPAMARGGHRRAAEWEAAGGALAPPPRHLQLLFVLAVAAPGLYPTLVRTSALPPGIRALQEPGRIAVVEFFDFGCPHCRALGPRLTALLEPYGERIHLVRRHVPLDSHPGARDAARIAVCAEEQGRGEAVVGAFWSADLREQGELKRLALEQGVDEARLGACLASERPDVRLAADRALLLDSDYVGLPTTYVGETRVLGAAPDEVFRDALERAARGEDRGGLSPWSYWILVACLAAAPLGLRRASRGAPGGAA